MLATTSATPCVLKYGLLKKVVCSSLTIQNGNADCERSLSDNKNTLSAERTNLGYETLMGLRRMKEHARSLGGAHMVKKHVHHQENEHVPSSVAVPSKSRIQD